MRLVIINGTGESGKDAVCDIAYDLLGGRVRTFSTIDPVKRLAAYTRDIYCRCGWDLEKDEKGRRFLSDLKDVWNHYNQGPYIIACETVKAIDHPNQSESPDICFLHSREPSEIGNLKHDLVMFNPVTLLVRRPGGRQAWGNHTDDDVECYDYDYELDNDGTLEALSERVKTFLAWLKQ